MVQGTDVGNYAIRLVVPSSASSLASGHCGTHIIAIPPGGVINGTDRASSDRGGHHRVQRRATRPGIDLEREGKIGRGSASGAVNALPIRGATAGRTGPGLGHLRYRARTAARDIRPSTARTTPGTRSIGYALALGQTIGRTASPGLLTLGGGTTSGGTRTAGPSAARTGGTRSIGYALALGQTIGRTASSGLLALGGGTTSGGTGTAGPGTTIADNGTGKRRRATGERKPVGGHFFADHDY